MIISLVPMDSVRNLTVISALGSDSILNVSWLPPATPNGVIINYELNVLSTSTVRFENVTNDTLQDNSNITRYCILNLGRRYFALLYSRNTTLLYLQLLKYPTMLR